MRIVLQDQTKDLPGDAGTSEVKSQPGGHVRVISIMVMAGYPFEGRNES